MTPERSVYDPDRHHRRSVRLSAYDYAAAGAYFVTICTSGRIHAFGEIDGGVLRPTRRGLIVRQCWEAIPLHRPTVALDAFAVMPNHCHGIVWITHDSAAAPTVGATLVSPSSARPRGPNSGSLGAIVGAFKAAVSREINKLRPGSGTGIWQPNYHEHIIRNQRELEAIRYYVLTNPERWDHDAENAVGDKSDEVGVFVQSLMDARGEEGRHKCRPYDVDLPPGAEIGGVGVRASRRRHA